MSILPVVVDLHDDTAANAHADRVQRDVAVLAPRGAALVRVIRQLDTGVGESAVGAEHDEGVGESEPAVILDVPGIPEIPDARDCINAEDARNAGRANVVNGLRPSGRRPLSVILI